MYEGRLPVKSVTPCSCFKGLISLHVLTGTSLKEKRCFVIRFWATQSYKNGVLFFCPLLFIATINIKQIVENQEKKMLLDENPEADCRPAPARQLMLSQHRPGLPRCRLPHPVSHSPGAISHSVTNMDQMWTKNGPNMDRKWTHIGMSIAPIQLATLSQSTL